MRSSTLGVGCALGLTGARTARLACCSNSGSRASFMTQRSTTSKISECLQKEAKLVLIMAFGWQAWERRKTRHFLESRQAGSLLQGERLLCHSTQGHHCPLIVLCHSTQGHQCPLIVLCHSHTGTPLSSHPPVSFNTETPLSSHPPVSFNTGTPLSSHPPVSFTTGTPLSSHRPVSFTHRDTTVLSSSCVLQHRDTTVLSSSCVIHTQGHHCPLIVLCHLTQGSTVLSSSCVI